jgi:hypothetical protein
VPHWSGFTHPVLSLAGYMTMGAAMSLRRTARAEGQLGLGSESRLNRYSRQGIDRRRLS